MKLNVFFITGVVTLLLLPHMVQAVGFAVGPTSVELEVPAEGENLVILYITSYEYNGDILIGTEGLLFDVYPEVMHLEESYKNHKIELRIRGNNSLPNGVYSGSLTFLGSTDENVAAGVKIGINVTQVRGSSAEDFLEVLRVNYLVILVAMLFIASLIVGIMIGRRR